MTLLPSIRSLRALNAQLKFLHHSRLSKVPSLNYSLPSLRYFSLQPSSEEDNLKKRYERTLPQLMPFPEIVWPSAFKTIKNWVLIHCIINPYLDREFTLRDFVFGAKQAVQAISSKLVRGDFIALNNLVTPDVISQVKPIVEKLGVSQRQELEIKTDDIYLTFPYEIGIIFNDDSDNDKRRWVEITVVFHVLRGLSEMRQRGDEIPWNLGGVPEYQNKVFICNYRFIKEFTTGKQSDWTVNIINHFKPIDLINE